MRHEAGFLRGLRPHALHRSAALAAALSLLAGCGGGGAGGGDGTATLGGRLVLPSTAFARAAAGDPPLHEQEPNDVALRAQSLGALRPGQSLTLEGALDVAAGDAREVLRVLLPERVRLTATLTLEARDHDADLVACDPTTLAAVATAPAAGPVRALHVVGKGLLDLVIRGAGGWRLDLAASPPAPALEASGDAAWLGEALPGDRLTLRGGGAVSLSAPLGARLRLVATQPWTLSAQAGDVRVQPGQAAWARIEPTHLARLAFVGGGPAGGLVVEASVLPLDAPGDGALAVGDLPDAARPAVAGYADVGALLRADQALVHAAPGREAEAADVLAAFGARLLDAIPGGALRVTFDLPGSADPVERAAATLARLLALSRSPVLSAVEPNHRRHALAVPNDPRYGEQWHYPLLRLPEAWDLTTGSAAVIVAVIDTGITAHPDLAGRSAGGYDFISDAANANDGGGRDGDPTDPGDGAFGEPPSWHGSHVAGTIGAASNNGVGVAGVTWGCRLMPLRVLGTEGGDDFDIANAILYAAGLPNVSGAVPAQRAHVINMSLGGGDANVTLSDAVRRARLAGVTIVAAAGNESTSQRSYPAAFDGVLAVGAVTRTKALASYSNTGPWVDCVAPGGDSARSSADGVLSTVRNDAGTAYTYASYDGTSMASPHVAGVAALVLSVAPDLTPDGVEGILVATAQDLGASGRDDTFGFGLVDAYAAVVRAQSGGTPPPPPPPAPPAPGGADETIYVLALDAATEETVAQADVAAGSDLSFALHGLPPGAYLLMAGTDRDGDGYLGDAGDLLGAWPSLLAPETLVLGAGEARLNLSLPLTDGGTGLARRAQRLR